MAAFPVKCIYFIGPEFYKEKPVTQDNVSHDSAAATPRPHASAGYSITLHVKIENIPGNFARIFEKVGETGASLAEVVLVSRTFAHHFREVTLNCTSEEHGRQIVELVSSLPFVELLSWEDDVFKIHEGGKLSVVPKTVLRNTDQLARAYTPGVARICKDIQAHPAHAYDYTIKGKTVAIVSDGTAVLGLGDIGPEGALPVMEGKAVLFKQFGGVDAFPICLNSKDPDEIVRAVEMMAPVFGGINLEDISAPRCFDVEERLIERLDIPVFHDDQHGTAVVVLAGLLNALKLTGRKIEDLRIVVNGFGAAGVACTKMLLHAGAQCLIACDSSGVIYRGRAKGMNSRKEQMLKFMNPDNEQGELKDALRGADMFLGISAPNCVTRDMVQTMAKDPFIFALANPVPEVIPETIRDIAAVIATGRSDYPNQINNVLCFPGIFKGALECRARRITEEMKVAAAQAIAAFVPEDRLDAEHVIPNIFDGDIASAVAERVKAVAAAGPRHQFSGHE